MLVPHSPPEAVTSSALRVVLKTVLCSQSRKPCSSLPSPALWLVIPCKATSHSGSREVVMATNDSAEGEAGALSHWARPCHRPGTTHCTTRTAQQGESTPTEPCGSPGTTYRECPHMDLCPGSEKSESLCAGRSANIPEGPLSPAQEEGWLLPGLQLHWLDLYL